jgi:hypothetical protein
MLCLLMAVATARSPESTTRSSRWWFQTHTPAYTTQALKIVEAHRASITGAYFYSGFSVGANGSFTSPPDEVVKARTAPFLKLGLTVGVALGVHQSAVEDGSALLGIPAAVRAASAANLTGLMIDYEPTTNISRTHSQAYADFVQALASALHTAGGRRISLDMCVSSWGILDKFDLFASTGVDGMMTMAATYFGANVSSNEGWVAKELYQGATRDQVRVGIGSTNAIYQKWNYNWTNERLDSFTRWLVTNGVRHLDVWRTDIDALNATDGTAEWVYGATADFLRQPSCTAPGTTAPAGTPACCGDAQCKRTPSCGGPPTPSSATVCTAAPPPPAPRCAALGEACDYNDDCCPDWLCHSIACVKRKCAKMPPPAPSLSHGVGAGGVRSSAAHGFSRPAHVAAS